MSWALNQSSLLKLQDPDYVKVVLDATFITSETRRDLSLQWQNRRILVIISHKDEWDLTEEGA